MGKGGKSGGGLFPAGSVFSTEGERAAARATNASANAANQQAAISQALFDQTQGLRDSTFGLLGDVLAGRTPATLAPVFRPARDTINAQFANARESILSTGARGGALQSLLAGAATDRASALGNLEGSLRSQLFGQALGVGTQMPALALTGFGGAGQLFQGQANQFAQQNQATQQGKGQLAATAALIAAKGCWVAAALYGADSAEFHLARAWIFDRWTGPVAAVTRRLYLAVGPWAARQRWLLPWLRPLFDRAVARARAVPDRG